MYVIHITEHSNMTYLNQDKLDPNRVFIFKKEEIYQSSDNDCSENNSKNNEEICVRVHELVGMLSEHDTNKYHKYIGFNKFTNSTFDIPPKDDHWLGLEEQIVMEYNEELEFADGDPDRVEKFESFAESMRQHRQRTILSGICNKDLLLFTNDKQIDFDVYHDWTCYETLDNYSIGFLVFVDKLNQNVHIYARTTDVVPDTHNHNDHIIFNRLVGKYTPVEIFIGKSEFNDVTEFSGGHGDRWNGNSILLRIGTPKFCTKLIGADEEIGDDSPMSQCTESEFRYLSIGTDIREFTTDEIITKYISSVGNNQVPYPYAESANWCYCMQDSVKTPINQHPDRQQIGSVAYQDNVDYIKMDCIIMEERNTDNLKIEYAEEVTEYTRMPKGSTFRLVDNSCTLYD